MRANKTSKVNDYMYKIANLFLDSDEGSFFSCFMFQLVIHQYLVT